MGRIPLQKELQPYIKGFTAFCSSPTAFTTVCSYGDDLVLGTTWAFRSTEMLKNFYRCLSAEGVGYYTVCNGGGWRMKTCPHCHIQVGGSAQYCPLCQNPLVGTPEPDRYPKVVPPARQTSLFYRIAAFVLLGAAVICGVVDYIMTEGRHMHWSLLVLIGAVGGADAAARTAAPGAATPLSCCSRFLIGTSLIVTFADYYAGWNGIAIDAIVPILCSVTLVLNFIFAFVNRRFTENGLVYLLLNIVVGVVPYIGLTLRHSVRPPMAWVICLIISMITFLGLVIFKGRSLLAEFEKRLHL